MKYVTKFKHLPLFKLFKDLETGELFRKTGAQQAFHNKSAEYAVVGEDREVEIEFRDGDLIAFKDLKEGDFFWSYMMLLKKIDNERALICSHDRIAKIDGDESYIKAII